MPRSSKPTGPKPVETYRHDEKRTNIPTNEPRQSSNRSTWSGAIHIFCGRSSHTGASAMPRR